MMRILADPNLDPQHWYCVRYLLEIMHHKQCGGSGSGISDPGSLPHPKFNIHLQYFIFKNGEKQEKLNFV
jgi:hypothetical protein